MDAPEHEPSTRSEATNLLRSVASNSLVHACWWRRRATSDAVGARAPADNGTAESP